MRIRKGVISRRNASEGVERPLCCFGCLLWLIPRFGCPAGICPVGGFSSWKPGCFDAEDCPGPPTPGLRIRQLSRLALNGFPIRQTSCSASALMSTFCGNLCWAWIWKSEGSLFSCFYSVIPATFPEPPPNSRASPNQYHPQKKRNYYFDDPISIFLPSLHLY